MSEIPIDTGTQPPDEYTDTALEFLQYVVDDLANYKQGLEELLPRLRLLQESLNALEADAIANPLHYVSCDAIANALSGLVHTDCCTRTALHSIEEMLDTNLGKQS